MAEKSRKLASNSKRDERVAATSLSDQRGKRLQCFAFPLEQRSV
jgi:hypothetical protein